MGQGYLQSIIAGSAAGMAVDASLYPLDTIKTRLQSAGGFRKTGGFSGVYRGLGPTIIGSAPIAAMFFCVYNSSKDKLVKIFGNKQFSMVYTLAAIPGEAAACLFRVPVEVVKQRRQTNARMGTTEILAKIIKQEGFLGFYRGYTSTILREIPCSAIQLTLWEHLKILFARYKNSQVSAVESSLCGAVAGGISAFVTTPFDVAKTRIMLARTASTEAQGDVRLVLSLIYGNKGLPGLFVGALPRTLWVFLGGFVFFGTYEFVTGVLQS